MGAGALIGTLAWGKRLDRDWKIVEAKYIRNGGKKPKSPTDLINFPLEHARTRTVWYPLVSIWLCTIGYGWTIQYSVHIAVPLIFQIVIGAGTVCIMSAFQALLLDLHPGRSASAAASVLSPVMIHLMVAEHREVLDGCGRQCSDTTYVVEIECWMDIYVIGTFVNCLQRACYCRGTTMGHEVAETEGGEKEAEKAT